MGCIQSRTYLASRISLYAQRPSSLAAVSNMMHCISYGSSIVEPPILYEFSDELDDN